LAQEAGSVRVIAGQYQHVQGPALTYSPMTVLDIDLPQGQHLILPAQHGDSTLLYLRHGQIQFTEQDELLEEQALAVMSSHGDNIKITALHHSKLLLLSGKPLGEPINGQGPFVMNTYDEIFSVHDKFHRTLVLSGFFFLKIASTFLNSSFFPKPIKRRIAI